MSFKLITTFISFVISLVIANLIFTSQVNLWMKKSNFFKESFDHEFPIFCKYDPILGYVGAANKKEVFEGQEYTQNEDGFRGKRIPREKNEGIKRILVLGDSQVWGLDASDQDTIPKLLEKYLKKSGVTEAFEIINLGMIGYSSTQIFLNYLINGKQLNPDIVVWATFPNDSYNNIMRFEHGIYRPEIYKRGGEFCFDSFPVKKKKGFYYSASLNEFYRQAREAGFFDFLMFRHLNEWMIHFYNRLFKSLPKELNEAFKIVSCNKPEIILSKSRIEENIVGHWKRSDSCEGRECYDLTFGGHGSILDGYYQGRLRFGPNYYEYRIKLESDEVDLKIDDAWISGNVAILRDKNFTIDIPPVNDTLSFISPDYSKNELKKGDEINLLWQKEMVKVFGNRFISVLLPSKFDPGKNPYAYVEKIFKQNDIAFANFHTQVSNDFNSYFSIRKRDDHLSARGRDFIARQLSKIILQRKLIRAVE